MRRREKFYLRSILAIALCVIASAAHAQVGPSSSVLFIDGNHTNGLRLLNGAKWITHSNGARLEFNGPLQYAERSLDTSLAGITEMTIGGWFFPRCNGEQYFFFRGAPEIGPQGERFFRPNDRFVNFVLVTDQRGFLLGT